MLEACGSGFHGNASTGADCCSFLSPLSPHKLRAPHITPPSSSSSFPHFSLIFFLPLFLLPHYFSSSLPLPPPSPHMAPFPPTPPFLLLFLLLPHYFSSSPYSSSSSSFPSSPRSSLLFLILLLPLFPLLPLFHPHLLPSLSSSSFSFSPYTPFSSSSPFSSTSSSFPIPSPPPLIPPLLPLFLPPLPPLPIHSSSSSSSSIRKSGFLVKGRSPIADFDINFGAIKSTECEDEGDEEDE